jgi:uncharacterized protein YodC (DUF2158 family)
MRASTIRPTVAAFSAVALLSWVGTAIAAPPSDVVTIDQAQALRGNVTPGDLAGFPVTISAPGSYRLTSNLTVSNANTSAIEINSPNVTVDLNGFTISGPNVCYDTLTGISCTLTGEGMGVKGGLSQPSLAEGIVITNGIIRGMGNAAIGMFSGNGYVRVSNVIAVRNGGPGIVVTSGSIVSNCIVTLNRYDGIGAGAASLVQNNTVLSNGGVGLRLGGMASAYEGNTVHGNFGGSIDGGVNMGHNVCGATLCP